MHPASTDSKPSPVIILISRFLGKLCADKDIHIHADLRDPRLQLFGANLPGLPSVTLITAQIDPRSHGVTMEDPLLKAGVVVRAREAHKRPGQRLQGVFQGSLMINAPTTVFILMAALCLAGSGTAFAQQGDGTAVAISTHVVKPKLVQPSSASLAAIKAPAGFTVSVFARDLKNARMIAVSDNGVMYVSRSDEGDVLLLTDEDRDGRRINRQ